MSVAERVIRIIAHNALMECNKISSDAALIDLGLDSLGLVEIIYDLEAEFDIQIPFNANEPAATQFDISTVARVIDGVEHLLKKSGN